MLINMYYVLLFVVSFSAFTFDLTQSILQLHRKMVKDELWCSWPIFIHIM